MNTKPILLWPKPRSDIQRHLDRAADYFLVVDTNSAYELQKLYKLRRETPIFDPFPRYGEHYRDFIDHVVASDCRYHIVGLEACQEVLRALEDSSLVHSSTEELLAAFELVCSAYNASSAGAFSRPSTIKRGEKISIDWSYLNWANTSVLAILVFVATVGGNFLSPNDSLIAAIIATPLFAALYVSVRANFSEIFSSNVATPGLMGSWLKK
ncbi:MAG: hypothetical protein WBV66_12335 [Pseudolabrys sp.]